MDHTHIAIFGAGYAGLMAATRLAHHLRNQRCTITVFAAQATFDERVRNHQRVAGAAPAPLELGPLLQRSGVRFVQGRIEHLDVAARTLRITGQPAGVTHRFDLALYALGSRARSDHLPGAAEHAYTLDSGSAARLALRLATLEPGGDGVLVIGGGHTGVEVSTELAEAYPALRVRLVTSATFSRNLGDAGRRHVRQALQRMGIELRENTPIARLARAAAMTRAGDALPFELCVLAGGFVPGPLARQAGLQVNGVGQILIDPAMRSVSHPHVFAAGDAALPAQSPGAPVRMALYTAIMMGAHAADCMAAEVRGRKPRPFGFSYTAFGVSLGRRDGVVQFLDPHRDLPRRLVFTGPVAAAVREMFVRFALRLIRSQRHVPWLFLWPGRNKMRHRARRQARVVPQQPMPR